MTASTSESDSLGVDIGGTKIEVARVDSEGEIQARCRKPVRPERNREKILDDIASTVREVSGEDLEQVESIGIGVAGLVDVDTGTLHNAPNLGWENVPLGAEMKSRLGCSVVICNDVDAATWGEWKHGAGQGLEDIICAFIGTGLGTGVITGGSLLSGHGSSAAELGHLPIIANGRDCTSPHRGCMEAYAGGWAIGERAREAVRENPENGEFLVELAGSVENITAKHVGEGYEHGNELCRELIQETGHLLGVWATGIVNVFNPGRIVMGGGVVHGIPDLVTYVEDELQDSTFTPHRETLEVTRAELEENAPVIGAATFARDRMDSS